MRSTDPIQIHISIQCPHTLHGAVATAKNINPLTPFPVQELRFLMLLYVNSFYLSMTFNVYPRQADTALPYLPNPLFLTYHLKSTTS